MMFFRPLAKSCLLFLALLIAGTAITQAEIATEAEMETVGQNWLSMIVHERGEWAGSSDPSIQSVQQITSDDGELLAHIYNVSPQGYIVVPRLKALSPIKSYSDDAELNAADEGGMAALLRELFTDAHKAYRHYYDDLNAPLPKDDSPFGQEYRQKWDHYTVTPEQFQTRLAAKDRDTTVSMGPLLTSHWSQGNPYYNDCPWGDGGRCVVGCVATAAAMIMDYHEWPPYGNGIARYWWGGDESCGGSTPASYLTVNLDDNYDWDNILDYVGSSSPQVQKDAVAELNYEVGVAYAMHYGRCGSGAYVFDGEHVFPDKFRYKDCVVRIDRPGQTKPQWFSYIQQDINDSLPVAYRITGHAIIADGYRVVDGIDQIHLNYGWNSSHTTWYTVDYVYCPWEGCTSADQMILTRIIPDRDVIFYIDTTYGFVPLTVNIEGASTLDVDSWVYDFGDGDSATTRSISYTYSEAGNFDVSLTAITADTSITFVREKLVVAIADTLIVPEVIFSPDSGAVVPIYLRNSAPIREMRIPINFAGDLDVDFDSLSVVGCRAENFETATTIHYYPGNQVTIKLVSESGPVAPLQAGAGTLLKVYFSANPGVDNGDAVALDVTGYSLYECMMYSDILDYAPELVSGNLICLSCCDGLRGNVNGDPEDRCDISDLIHLVDFMFNDGPDPGCWKEADLNGNHEIDVTDLVYLVNYMFQNGLQPLDCP